MSCWAKVIIGAEQFIPKSYPLLYVTIAFSLRHMPPFNNADIKIAVTGCTPAYRSEAR